MRVFKRTKRDLKNLNHATDYQRRHAHNGAQTDRSLYPKQVASLHGRRHHCAVPRRHEQPDLVAADGDAWGARRHAGADNSRAEGEQRGDGEPEADGGKRYVARGDDCAGEEGGEKKKVFQPKSIFLNRIKQVPPPEKENRHPQENATLPPKKISFKKDALINKKIRSHSSLEQGKNVETAAPSPKKKPAKSSPRHFKSSASVDASGKSKSTLPPIKTH